MKQFGMMVGLKKPKSFEGWFCKIDDQGNDLMLSVILGYSTHAKTKHAFIQFTNNIHNRTAYIRYPIDALEWQKDPFVLKIGNNQLSEKGIRLDFELEGTPVRGDFVFGDFEKIHESVLRPNIMGWLSYLPNECNHAIISMHHSVHGKLSVGDAAFDVAKADGYIEKDWGTGFPKEYVWVHANDGEKSSCVFSYASVPVLGRHAKGFFLMLHHEGKEYRFSSIEGSRMVDFHVGKESFDATIKKGDLRLSLKANNHTHWSWLLQKTAR